MRMRLFLALLLMVPAAGQAGVRPRYGGTLRVLLPARPAEPHPSRAETFAELLAVRATGETLLEVDSLGRLAPALLEAVPELEDGGRTVRLRLAPALAFHDGEPLTAARVAESLENLGAPGSPNAFLLAPIVGAAAVHAGATRSFAGIEVLSERELKIDLAYPFPDFPAVLATLPSAIVHQTPRGAEDGAGPFVAVDEGAQGLVLEPFEGFHGGRPFADEVVLRGSEGRLTSRTFPAGEAELVVRAELLASATPVELPRRGLVLAVVSRRLAGAESIYGALRALDRADLARFVRAPASPVASLLSPAGPSSPAAADPPPEKLPARLRVLLPAAPDSPRGVAARLQVKLYDRGVRVALESVAKDGLSARLYAGDFEAAIVPLWLYSHRPALVLAQVAAAVGGYDAGARFLREAAEADEAHLAPLAAALERELLVVPLYAYGLRVGVAEGVAGLALHDDGTLDLGGTWLLPMRSGP